MDRPYGPTPHRNSKLLRKLRTQAEPLDNTRRRLVLAVAAIAATIVRGRPDNHAIDGREGDDRMPWRGAEGATGGAGNSTGLDPTLAATGLGFAVLSGKLQAGVRIRKAGGYKERRLTRLQRIMMPRMASRSDTCS